MIRTTHTFATLEVSRAAYDEIAMLLRKAEYRHAFMPDGEIDMHGIALVPPETNQDASAVASASR